MSTRRLCLRLCDAILLIVFVVAIIIGGYLAFKLRIWEPYPENNPPNPELLTIFYICCGVTGVALVMSILLCCLDRCCHVCDDDAPVANIKHTRKQGTMFRVHSDDNLARSFNSNTTRPPWQQDSAIELVAVPRHTGLGPSTDVGEAWIEPSLSVSRGGEFEWL